MAWRASSSSNAGLIANLAQHGLIRSDRVKQAMLDVDRAHYAPSMAYQDSPQSIGYQATISAPHMHANAAESLLAYLHPKARVLDIGSGSGYLTHVFANLLPEGTVIGIDHIQGLVDLAKTNMAKSEDGREFLESGRVLFVKGDGRKGFRDKAPYDAIHVGAAAAEAHEELIDQLASPGRMFIPVEDKAILGGQHIWTIDKDENGKVHHEKSYRVMYVKLTDAPKDEL